MQREKTVSKRLVARIAGRPEHGVRHLFLLLTLVILLLIAVLPGQAVIGAEYTAPVVESATAPADVPARPQADQPAIEAAPTKGRESAWQPPPMPKPAPFATVNISPEEAEKLLEKWGVELLGMRLASAGYMLDFRFRVLDADKALPLFDHRIKPHIVAERSNIKLPVPMAAKVGAFRPTNRGKNIKADKTYYMIFGNPDRHVKAGETVTVVIGDFKVEHLLVN